MSVVEKPAGHAFLSYVREDSHNVDKLQRTLEAAGVAVWRDTADLWPGEDWRAKIRRAITDNALVFIACFSSRSIGRLKSYQNEELLMAVEQLRLRRPHDPWLIPVRFDDCDIPDFDLGASRTLASIQRVDLFGKTRDMGIARLVRAVVQLLDQQSHERDGVEEEAREPTAHARLAAGEGDTAHDRAEPLDARLSREAASHTAPPARYQDETGERHLVVLDRAALTQALGQLADRASQTKILVVNGPRGSGKSFTFQIIVRFAEQVQTIRLAYVDLAHDPVPGPVDLARELALRMGLSPDPVPPEHAQAARYVRELAIWLVGRAQASDRDWWWTLDGLSSPALPAETRDLVRALAAEVRYASSVRLVLLDFNEPLSADVWPFVFREELPPIGEREVRDFIHDLAVRQGIAITPPMLDGLVSEALGYLPVVTDRLGEVSARLSKLADSMRAGLINGPERASLWPAVRMIAA